MADVPTPGISRDTSSILLAAVSKHYTSRVAKAIEQMLETYRIIESIQVQPQTDPDLAAIFQPLAENIAASISLVLRAPRTDHCRKLLETLGSINIFVKEFVSDGLSCGVSGLRAEAKHYQARLQRELEEALDSEVHLSQAQDSSMGVFPGWAQNTEGRTGHFEGFAQQQNESQPPPAAATDSNTPPLMSTPPTSPQKLYPTISSVVIGNQNTINFTCHSTSHDSGNATTATVADSGNDCSVYRSV